MAPSVFPSTQWTSVVRGRLPMIAASDIVPNAPVRLASSGDWAVQMVASSNEEPIGIARDWAAAGQAVSVFDIGNVIRAAAGATVTRQQEVGVVGASQVIHPISGVSVSYPVLGPVIGTPSVAVGASQSSVWSVAKAFESAGINQEFAFRVNPRLLSGRTDSN